MSESLMNYNTYAQSYMYITDSYPMRDFPTLSFNVLFKESNVNVKMKMYYLFLEICA